MSTDGYDPRLGTPVGATPGGLGKRAGARFIDWIVAGVVGAILFWILNKFGTPEWLSILPGAGFAFLYFIGFEVTTGATPGKKLLGLQVEGAGGAAKPGLKESAFRNSYMLLNLIPCIGGVLWFFAALGIAVTISSSPTKQGWHDRFADGTRVVEDQ
ncbi:RDD family protein [Nocardia speluncae]|uniref:RDD family protein n=1 Tax=Nocardia speluncae TaxID=419477 RepID=A0A846X8D9_9NOCA|nr:RDD family protein [Nocardia speluncae]NKY32238.1 RDD family protein [Nocardia speluncae]